MVFAPGISPLHRLTPARYLDSHALSSALRDDKTVPSVARQNKVKYQTTRNGKKTYYIYILAYYLYNKTEKSTQSRFLCDIGISANCDITKRRSVFTQYPFSNGDKTCERWTRINRILSLPVPLPSFISLLLLFYFSCGKCVREGGGSDILVHFPPNSST